MALLKGWRYRAFIGGIVGLVSAAMYPILVDPLLHVDEYKEIQAKNREGIRQEDIQPGNMKVWTDPFERKKE